jgi:hypothetical protein
MSPKERGILIGVLAACAASGAWLQSANPVHMELVCQEDGFVEYAQAFLYFFAGATFAYVGSHKPFRNVWYWGYALLFLAIAGEEVSWGQRIFDLATPAALDAINVQHETTIHNIGKVQHHLRLVALLVSLGISWAIPLTDRFVPALRRVYRLLDMPVFPLWVSPLSAIGAAFMIVPRLRGAILFNLDEMGELYFALAFFGFGLSAYRKASAALEREEAREGAVAQPLPA